MDIVIVPLLMLIKTIIGITVTVIVADVILSWLVALNVLNTSNKFVYSIVDVIAKISNCMLNPIRSRMSLSIEGIDFSPVLLLVLLTFLEHVITRILLRFV